MEVGLITSETAATPVTSVTPILVDSRGNPLNPSQESQFQIEQGLPLEGNLLRRVELYGGIAIRMDIVFFSVLTAEIISKLDLIDPNLDLRLIDIHLRKIINGNNYDIAALNLAISTAMTSADLSTRARFLGSSKLPAVAYIPATLPLIAQMIFGFKVDTLSCEGDMLLAFIKREGNGRNFYARLLKFMALASNYVKIAGNGSNLSARIAAEMVTSDSPLSLYYDLDGKLITIAGAKHVVLGDLETHTPIGEGASGLGLGPQLSAELIRLGFDLKEVNSSLGLYTPSIRRIVQADQKKLTEFISDQHFEMLPPVRYAPLAFFKLKCNLNEIEQELGYLLQKLDKVGIDRIKVNSYADGGVSIIATSHDHSDVREFMSALEMTMNDPQLVNLRVALTYGPLQSLTVGQTVEREGKDRVGEVVNRAARLIYSHEEQLYRSRIIVDSSMVEAFYGAGAGFIRSQAEDYSWNGAKGYSKTRPLQGLVFKNNFTIEQKNSTLRYLEEQLDIAMAGFRTEETGVLATLEKNTLYRATILDFIAFALEEKKVPGEHIDFLMRTVIALCNLDKQFSGGTQFRASSSLHPEQSWEKLREQDLKTLAVVIVSQLRFTDAESTLRIILEKVGQVSTKLAVPTELLSQLKFREGHEDIELDDPEDGFKEMREALMIASEICLGREYKILERTLLACGVSVATIHTLIMSGYASKVPATPGAEGGIVLRPPLARIIDQKFVGSDLRMKVHLDITRLKTNEIFNLNSDVEGALSLILHAFNIRSEDLKKIEEAGEDSTLKKLRTALGVAMDLLWGKHRYESIVTVGPKKYEYIANGDINSEIDLYLKYINANMYLGNFDEAQRVLHKINKFEDKGSFEKMIEVVNLTLDFLKQINSESSESSTKFLNRITEDAGDSSFENAQRIMEGVREIGNKSTSLNPFVRMILYFIYKHENSVLTSIERGVVRLAKSSNELPI